MVFTASEKAYADPILDMIDPDHTLISARYYRDSCFILDGTYVKDLRIFNKSLAEIIIVDNSLAAFRL